MKRWRVILLVLGLIGFGMMQLGANYPGLAQGTRNAIMFTGFVLFFPGAVVFLLSCFGVLFGGIADRDPMEGKKRIFDKDGNIVGYVDDD